MLFLIFLWSFRLFIIYFLFMHRLQIEKSKILPELSGSFVITLAVFTFFETRVQLIMDEFCAPWMQPVAFGEFYAYQHCFFNSLVTFQVDKHFDN